MRKKGEGVMWNEEGGGGGNVEWGEEGEGVMYNGGRRGME